MDGNGSISWSEFKQIYGLMVDSDKMATLPMDIQRAIRKIQYSSLPNPDKYLAMFKGLPFTYRRSILAEVDVKKENAFDYIVCRNPNLEVRNGSGKTIIITSANDIKIIIIIGATVIIIITNITITTATVCISVCIYVYICITILIILLLHLIRRVKKLILILKFNFKCKLLV
jgi:hypothetical protein